MLQLPPEIQEQTYANFHQFHKDSMGNDDDVDEYLADFESVKADVKSYARSRGTRLLPGLSSSSSSATKTGANNANAASVSTPCCSLCVTNFVPQPSTITSLLQEEETLGHGRSNKLDGKEFAFLQLNSKAAPAATKAGATSPAKANGGAPQHTCCNICAGNDKS
jgi:hypothetical protein